MKAGKKKTTTVKTKKTEKNIELILSLISIAKPIAEACKAAGVNPDSFYTWLNKDEKLAANTGLINLQHSTAEKTLKCFCRQIYCLFLATLPAVVALSLR